MKKLLSILVIFTSLTLLAEDEKVMLRFLLPVFTHSKATMETPVGKDIEIINRDIGLDLSEVYFSGGFSIAKNTWLTASFKAKHEKEESDYNGLADNQITETNEFIFEIGAQYDISRNENGNFYIAGGVGYLISGESEKVGNSDESDNDGEMYLFSGYIGYERFLTENVAIGGVINGAYLIGEITVDKTDIDTYGFGFEAGISITTYL